MSGGGGGAGLGIILSLVRSKFGWAGVIVLMIGYFVLTRVGPSFQSGAVDNQQGVAAPADDEQAQFVGFVLDDAQDTWTTLLPQYRRAKLVLFTDSADTACGMGEAATGPFYCPGDERVYIDLGFYRALRDKLGAPGDFAQAYVIAHEVGHHVQNILGTSARVQRAGRSTGAEGDSVRLELQADCYAGVWAFHANKRRQLLEQGDIEEALTAAAAIGDDTLQKNATGRVRPESFSHGSSAQRVKWFNTGFAAGDPATCDTFAARSL